MHPNSSVTRPRRSVLYVPGASARALDKAANLPADALILDLEDAVLPAAKPAARAALVERLAQRDRFGQREIVVRVNGLDTPWGHDDVRALAQSGADAVLFPKIDSPAELRAALAALDAAGAPPGLAAWVMAETPGGVTHCDAIAGLDPRLAAIVMGTADLAKALRLPADPARTGLLAALSRCVLAARAHALDILDGVQTDLGDDAGFASACRQGRALGFDGKTLIHPRQIPVANEVFGVTDEAAQRAAGVIAAWEQAATQGSGIAVFEGQMVERLHADEARRVLALRAAIEQRSEDAE